RHAVHGPRTRRECVRARGAAACWLSSLPLSTHFSNRNVVVPPRADVTGTLVIAVHDIKGRPYTRFRDINTHVTGKLAILRGEPGTIVTPQTRALGALVGRPARSVDAATTPAIFEQKFGWRPGIERCHLVIDVPAESRADHRRLA